jgi:hypothetical protein
VCIPASSATGCSSAAPMTAAACSAAILLAALRCCLALRCRRSLPPLFRLLPNPFALMSERLRTRCNNKQCVNSKPNQDYAGARISEQLAALSSMQACSCSEPSMKSCRNCSLHGTCSLCTISIKSCWLAMTCDKSLYACNTTDGVLL